MKRILFLSLLISTLLSDMIPISKKNFVKDREESFGRGSYLIVLSNSSLNNAALSFFTNLKKTQGFDVDVVSFREGDDDIEGINGVINDDLRNYLINYYSQNQMLEYVLLVGDVNQNNENCTFPDNGEIY